MALVAMASCSLRGGRARVRISAASRKLPSPLTRSSYHARQAADAVSADGNVSLSFV